MKVKINMGCHAEYPEGVSGGRQSVRFTDGQFRGKSVVAEVPVTPLQTLVGKDKEGPSSTEGFVMLPEGVLVLLWYKHRFFLVTTMHE